jgi:hypothetical protein
MSEGASTRATPYPAALKDELAEMHTKLDSLIRHWADAAEMPTIMDQVRATITEAHQALHQDLATVRQLLNLALTPVEVEPPPRWRLVVWSLVGLVGLLFSFWLGGFAPWVRAETKVAQAHVRRLDAFVSDLHTTLQHAYSQLPKGVQTQLQDNYRTHHYEPLQAVPELKKP